MQSADLGLEPVFMVFEKRVVRAPVLRFDKGVCGLIVAVTETGEHSDKKCEVTFDILINNSLSE